mgnify:CR=1 FL=1
MLLCRVKRSFINPYQLPGSIHEGHERFSDISSRTQFSFMSSVCRVIDGKALRYWQGTTI